MRRDRCSSDTKANRHKQALKALQKVCQRIEAVGKSLKVKKKDGRVVAQNWDDPEFAVAINEMKEIGDRNLSHYQSPDSDTSGIYSSGTEQRP